MSADLGLVPHAAQRHAHEFATRGLGNRAAKRRLADAGRSDEAQDRSGQLVRALLHGQIFKNAFLDLVEPEMIEIEHVLGSLEILAHLGTLAPWNRQDPVEIIAHHRRFRRHG